MAVIVTYYARNNAGLQLNNSVTPPTAIQASQVPTIKALVVFGVTADVQALITHNWGLDASAPNYYDPEAFHVQISDGTYAPSLTYDFSNTNVVKVNKLGSNQPITVLVTLRRGTGPVGSGPWQ